MILLAAAVPAGTETLVLSGSLEWQGRHTPSSPLLRVGPLVPSGLLRELADPLGFDAGSYVFEERSGFTVDGSSTARPAGFVCLPPGAIGVFGAPLEEGGAELGAFLNSAPRKPWRAEAAAWFSEPPAVRFGDSWYRVNAPFPGGQLLDVGCRLRTVLPGISFGATFGGSLGTSTGPGWLLQLNGTAAAGPLEVSFFGGGSGGYRSPSGTVSPAAWRASGRGRLAVSESTAELCCTLEIARPGFAPRPYLAERLEIGVVYERGFRVADGTRGAFRFEAAKRIDTDPQGNGREDARCSGGFSLSSGRLGASVALSWSSQSGAAGRAVVTFDPAELAALEVQAGWSAHERASRLAVSWKIRPAS